MAKLDNSTLEQLRTIFSALSTPVMLLVKGMAGSEKRKEMEEFIGDFVSVSDQLTMRI